MPVLESILKVWARGLPPLKGADGDGGGGVGLTVALFITSKFTSDSIDCCCASTSTVVTLDFLKESVNSSVVCTSDCE